MKKNNQLYKEKILGEYPLYNVVDLYQSVKYGRNGKIARQYEQ